MLNGNRRPSRLAYSVRELATMTGISKGRVARLLESNGVEFAHSGNKRLVFISSLEAALPSLVDSVRFRGDDDE